MPYNKVDGHPALIRNVALNVAQFAIVQKLIEWNKGDPLFRITQLHKATQAVTGKNYCPFFIGKNRAAQVTGKHVYDLSRFKLSTKPAPVKKAKPVKKSKPEKTEPAIEPTEPPVTPTPKPKKSKGKKGRPKKEAKAKREQKVKLEIEVPVEEVPVETEVPVEVPTEV